MVLATEAEVLRERERRFLPTTIILIAAAGSRACSSYLLRSYQRSETPEIQRLKSIPFVVRSRSMADRIARNHGAIAVAEANIDAIKKSSNVRRYENSRIRWYWSLCEVKRIRRQWGDRFLSQTETQRLNSIQRILPSTSASSWLERSSKNPIQPRFRR